MKRPSRAAYLREWAHKHKKLTKQYRQKYIAKQKLERGEEYRQFKIMQQRNWRKEQRDKTADFPRPECCMICDLPAKLYWDHDHKHGNFRGWICRHCNLFLGHVKDSPEILRKMIHYLERANLIRILKSARLKVVA